MDARAKRISEILHTGDQYRVPFFQRSYSWQRKEWSRLWDDLIDLSDNDVRTSHFLGSMVCTPLPHRPGEVNGYLLIDGQQRLTTLTILLCALADVLREEEDVDGADAIREDFILHRRRKGDDRYKVLPRPGDKELLAKLVDGADASLPADSRITTGYRYFKKQIAGVAAVDGLEGVRKVASIVTESFQIVVITIDEEDPYEIFESLNSTGLPLGEADLVRNYVFMKVKTEEQEEFDAEMWAPLEAFFETHSRGQARGLEDFYRAYLVSRVGYIRRGRTYARFRDEYEERGLTPESAVGELHRFLGYERLLTGCDPGGPPIDPAVLEDFVEMDARTAVPLFFSLMEGISEGRWSASEAEGALHQLNSFLLRRALCRESTRPYGQWFATAALELKESGLSWLTDYLVGRGWPDDDALVREIRAFPIYQREARKARHLLLRLERRIKSKEPVDPAKLTLEHVMPQSIGQGSRGKAWKSMLGDEWREVHSSLLHTFGNLTLSGYNSELGNRPYGEKRIEFEESRLGLNEYFSAVDEWCGDAIEQRSERLGRQVGAIWKRPEGLRYLPGQRSARKVSKAEREEWSLEFWSEMVPRLGSRAERWSDKRPTKTGRLQLETGHRFFRWSLYALPGYLAISLTIKGERAQEFLSAIQESADSIEEQLGYSLDWESGNQSGVQRFVTLARSDFALIEKDCWPEEQQWLLDRLLELEEVFGPFFQELAPILAPESEDDRGYWESKLSTSLMGLWDRLLESIGGRAKTDVTVRYGPRFLVCYLGESRRVAFRCWPRRSHLSIRVLAGDQEALLQRLSTLAVNARRSATSIRFDLSLEIAAETFDAVASELAALFGEASHGI